MSVEWNYNPLLQSALADAVLEPEPTASGTSTPIPTPTSCVGVTLDQFNVALADLRAFIFTELADVRSDIVNAIPPAQPVQDCATSADLTAAKDDILSAIANISVTPPAPSGYAKVGSTQFAKLADAAIAVSVGGIVEIYGEILDLNASAAFLKSCTIRGMTPDAKLNWTLGTSERMAFGKGLIVCNGTGNTYLIENLELTGARVVDRNGAGVRADEGTVITVRNCNIHDNENGVLAISDSVVIQAGCIFKDNGNSSGSGHGIYINSPTVNEVTIEDSTFYAALIGNQIKSRAKKTTVRYNTVAELDGHCSWQIDISNGGEVLIDKNVIEQGQAPDNWNMISYGPEGLTADGRINTLTVTDNIIINDHANAVGILIFGNSLPTSYLIDRNTFVGPFDNYAVNATLGPNTTIFATRAAAGYAPFPFLPQVPAP
jgi:hypothetical protein